MAPPRGDRTVSEAPAVLAGEYRRRHPLVGDIYNVANTQTAANPAKIGTPGRTASLCKIDQIPGADETDGTNRLCPQVPTPRIAA